MNITMARLRELSSKEIYRVLSDLIYEVTDENLTSVIKMIGVWYGTLSKEDINKIVESIMKQKQEQDL